MTFREFISIQEQGTAMRGFKAGGRASQSPFKPEMGVTKPSRITLPSPRIELRVKPIKRI